MSDLFSDARVAAPAVSRRQSVVAGRRSIDQETRRDAAHLCRVCGIWAGFGFKNPGDGLYRWACATHCADVERMG